MTKSFRIAVMLVLAALFLPLAATAGDSRLPVKPAALNPSSHDAPLGFRTYADPNCYTWYSEANFGVDYEAEWAPWDPWWTMSYEQWASAEGFGRYWIPVLPPWSMSPLGWGFDSWYGGWYGFLPAFDYVGSTPYQDTLYAKGWMYRHRRHARIVSARNEERAIAGRRHSRSHKAHRRTTRPQRSGSSNQSQYRSWLKQIPAGAGSGGGFSTNQGFGRSRGRRRHSRH